MSITTTKPAGAASVLTDLSTGIHPITSNGAYIGRVAGMGSASGAQQIYTTDEITVSRMRDTIFEELISIVKEKGSITADELTHMWRCTKMLDKLKGIK